MLGRFQYNGCLKLFGMSARLGAALRGRPKCAQHACLERLGRPRSAAPTNHSEASTLSNIQMSTLTCSA
jgi:hypothetical protein